MRRGAPAHALAEPAGILKARTLASGHPALLALLRPGLSVLDVGCGPGNLTREMARRVSPGAVVGMDLNPEMIAAAEAGGEPGETPNLVFYRGDIRASRWSAEFDVVNAARVLQWIADLPAALTSMARAVRPGGRVVALDFNHARAEWSHPPAPWTRFYAAFLEWRAAAGLDNAVADRLPALCEAAGLSVIRVARRPETVRAGEPDFYRAAGIWRLMIESRGRQMVAAGGIGEIERRAALDAFTEWMQTPGATQTLDQHAVVATRPAA